MKATAASCHAPDTGRSAPSGSPVVAFIGAPNGGKSTLFNRITGAQRVMGNWPGTTVEIGRGTWDLDDRHSDVGHCLDVIDFPRCLLPRPAVAG